MASGALTPGAVPISGRVKDAAREQKHVLHVAHSQALILNHYHTRLV